MRTLFDLLMFLIVSATLPLGNASLKFEHDVTQARRSQEIMEF